MAKMHYRYSAMNSGKTTRLIQEAHNYESSGMQIVVAKPEVDVKGAKTVLSRVGLDRSVDFLIAPEDNVVELLAPFVAKNSLACVFVDEAQFLQPPQVDELYWEISEDMDIPVIAYGLRADFLGVPFPASERLLALADEMQEIPTICRCGKKARMNTRMVDGVFVFEGEQVAIDGVESVTYTSLCKSCYRQEYKASG